MPVESTDLTRTAPAWLNLSILIFFVQLAKSLCAAGFIYWVKYSKYKTISISINQCDVPVVGKTLVCRWLEINAKNGK